jgi:hypothetical protein
MDTLDEWMVHIIGRTKWDGTIFHHTTQNREQFKSYELGQVLVAHTCNPSYSGGRDQEECGSKTAWANSLPDPISNKFIIKEGWCSGSRCRACVQTSVPHTKKIMNHYFWNFSLNMFWPRMSTESLYFQK